MIQTVLIHSSFVLVLSFMSYFYHFGEQKQIITTCSSSSSSFICSHMQWHRRKYETLMSRTTRRSVNWQWQLPLTNKI